MVAYAMGEEREKVTAAGMNDQIVKRILPKEFFQVHRLWTKSDEKSL